MEKLRRCKGSCFVRENNKWIEKAFDLGYFHVWGVNYEEFCEGGPGNYSIAIVELPDGRIVTPLPENIVFLDLIEDGKES